MARTADAAIAAAIVALLAGCGSSSHGAPSVTHTVTGKSKQHHVTGPTHPGGNGTKGE